MLNYSFIDSAVGRSGNWSDEIGCNSDDTYLKGAQLRAISVPIKPYVPNKMIATNLKMLCTDSALLNGNGGTTGFWSKMVACPQYTAICGIQTMAIPPMITAVKFLCCYLPVV